MKHLLAFLLVAAVALAACEGDRPVAPRDGPMALVSDGAHTGGNPDFFFLPPLVGNPSSEPTFEPGMFNRWLQPVLTVHTLPATSDLEPPCGGEARFGPVAVPAVPDEEIYKIEWDTDDANLTPEVSYRLCVWSSLAAFELDPEVRTPLGFIDVQPVTGGVKSLKTGDVFAYQDGRVIPVKFRIEYGALSFDPDYPEAVSTKFTVDNTGGSAILYSYSEELGQQLAVAAVDVPSGAVLPGDEVTVVLAQEQPQYDGQCLPGGLLQSGWCYQIRTWPELYEFQQLVRAEICVDASPVPERLWDYLRVFKNNATEGLVELPWEEPTLIGPQCTGPLEELGAAKSVVDWLGRLAGRLFAPKDLRATMFGAVPKGLGGSGGSFSDFGGAVPALPDLVVSSVTLQTTDVTPGGSITYEYTISNIGAEGPDGNSSFDAATYLSSDPVLDAGDVELIWGYSSWDYHLDEGWSQSITMSDVPVPDTVPPGTYYLIVVADARPGMQYPGVVESDETNNWLASSAVLEVTSIKIDGVLSEGEWVDATEIPVSEDGTTLFVMNDESYIYFAMLIPTPGTEEDGFEVRFDNANNGVLDPDEDNICIGAPGPGPAGGRSGDCHSYYDEIQDRVWWDGSDVEQNVTWAVTSGGAGKIFEVARPLSSGDPYDLDLTAGDVVGYCATYFTGSTYVDYPAGCIYVLSDLSTYAKLEIGPP